MRPLLSALTLTVPTVIVLAGLTASCAHGPAFAPPPAGVAVVTMTNGLRFVPDTITIRAGDSVEWRNKAIMAHTVTANPAAVKDPSHVALPPGVAPFDSGEIPSGQVWTHRFTTPGTYRYVCKPHEGLGMRATVVVR